MDLVVGSLGSAITCSFRPNHIADLAARGIWLRAAARFVALPLAALLVSCAGGTSGGGNAGSPATPASVSVVPATITVPTSATAQFVATVQNSPGSTVQWEVNRIAGGNTTIGTITANGLYRAPAIVPGTTVKITAALQADTNRFGSADVTVVPPVSLSPRQAALTASQTLQLQAGGPGVGNSTVNWSASGGSVSAGGLYTPPATAGIFTVTATSRSDPAASATSTMYVTNFAGHLCWRNDPGLTGQNRQELALNPATLATGLFGKISSCAVDGQVYAQPLYLPGLTDGSSIRNVVYVATQHNSVYAFDADATPCRQIWTRSFLDDASGASPVPAGEILGNDISPEIGITGTPVIDRASGTLYVVARTKESGPSGPAYFQRLHALDIATGNQKFGGPVAIAASAPGTGDGSTGAGQVLFHPLLENQRAALHLSGGRVYVAFSGHGQASSHHGWLLVYDAATLAPAGVFNTTPNGSRGGFAQSGAGPSADAAGNVFAATGQGTFDAGLPALFRKNFGQTLMKLQFSPILAIADTFTPSNQAFLTLNQGDFGSSGVLVLPDQIGAPNPRLAVIGGTHGALYLINRDDLGGFTPSPGPDRVLKTLNLAKGIYGTPAYWQNALYVAAAGDALKAFSLAGGTLAEVPHSQSSATIGSPGASPAISSNGASGGIVWVLDTSGADSTPAGPAVLRAFEAANLARELFSSTVKADDAAGPAVRMAVPMVANGRVYVGTQNELTVYGLLP